MDDSIGHGTLVQRSADGLSTGVFSSVGKVRDIGVPAVARDVEDVTHMESPENWREYIGSTKDGGQLDLDITFDPGSAEMVAMYTDLNTNTPGYYKLVFPDATEYGFSGLVVDIAPTAPVSGKMAANVSVKVSGKPGWIA